MKPPLCKGRWHFREKMTEGLAVSAKVLFTNPSVSLTLNSSLYTREPFFGFIKLISVSFWQNFLLFSEKYAILYK